MELSLIRSIKSDESQVNHKVKLVLKHIAKWRIPSPNIWPMYHVAPALQSTRRDFIKYGNHDKRTSCHTDPSTSQF